MENEQWEYRVGGRLQGMIPLAIFCVVFGGLSILLHRSHNGAALFVDLFLAVVFLLTVAVIYRFLFVKVLIGVNGFLHQTKPGRGKYYTYSEISEGWASSGISQNGTIACYCGYKTRDGQTVKFAFDLFEADAIHYFLCRINGEDTWQEEENEEEELYEE